MFTWICPQCGREVPPAYNDCPDCAKKNAQAAGPVAPAPPAAEPTPPPPPQPAYYQQPPQSQPAQPPPPPQQPLYAPPQGGPPQPPPAYAPQQPAQVQPYYAQPSQAPPAYYPPPPAQRARGMNLPIWLMTIVFALAIGGVVLGVVWLASGNRGSAGTGPAPTATVESPAAKPGAKTSAMQKYIEVTGVRFVLDAKKKTLAKFVIVNHSEADISGLAGNVTIWGRTKKSEEDAQGTFSFSTNLAPFESKEMTAPLNTKLKIYELGDWQNVTTDVQITAPAGGA